MNAPKFTSFERGVLKAVMIIGTLRAILELSLDRLPETGLADFYMDLAALLLFVFGLALVFSNGGDNLIRWAFFVPLVILICFGLYFYGGLYGSTGLLVYGLAVVINLTMRRRTLLFFNIFLIFSTVFTFYLLEKEVQRNPISFADENPVTFVFITVATILLTNIGKNSFEEKRSQLVSLKSELESRQKELEQGNRELTHQNEKLKSLRSELKQKVKERSRLLKQQNDSIESYMKLTLVELMIPYEKALGEIRGLSGEDDILQMLISSGEKLQYEVELLKRKLEGTADE